MAATPRLSVSAAIPTYNRGVIAADAVERLLRLTPAPSEILLVDQTAQHSAEVEVRLSAFVRDGRIRWIRLAEPSIPHAMNEALRLATGDLVLFLDDDVVPVSDLVAAHAEAYVDKGVWAVAGQVLEPGEEPAHLDVPADPLAFRFRHDTATDVGNVMAGNLSVDRLRARAMGGFDENFVMVAYRFESDFALRIIAAGGRIRYEPRASVRHLKIASGGIRTWGDHRTSAHPAHSAGDYYFALHHAPSFARYVVTRLRRNVLTRYHLRHPWAIPAKLVGELRGLLLGRKLARGGRKVLQ
jgi:GT2 family glycosyltransferase